MAPCSPAPTVTALWTVMAAAAVSSAPAPHLHTTLMPTADEDYLDENFYAQLLQRYFSVGQVKPVRSGGYFDEEEETRPQPDQEKPRQVQQLRTGRDSSNNTEKSGSTPFPLSDATVKDSSKVSQRSLRDLSISKVETTTPALASDDDIDADDSDADDSGEEEYLDEYLANRIASGDAEMSTATSASYLPASANASKATLEATTSGSAILNRHSKPRVDGPHTAFQKTKFIKVHLASQEGESNSGKASWNPAIIVSSQSQWEDWDN